MASTQQPLTVRVEEAAQMLNIGRSLAWRQVREGRWPALRVGDRVLLSRSFIERLVAELDPDHTADGAEENARGVASRSFSSRTK